MQLKIKRVREGVALPAYETAGAAAMDLRAVCGEEGIRLEPGQRTLVPTGLAIELPGPEAVALIFARSSLGAKHGLALPNGVGVIDSDYRGEVFVALANFGQEAYTVQNGERIAQMAILPVAHPQLVEVEALSDTPRGGSGFGSTGKF